MTHTGERETGHASGQPDGRHMLVKRILESETFRRSNRLKSLLSHLCERAFAGHGDELSEQLLGMAIYGRPADYDSANDNVVRVAVRQLRLKLQEYFETEGQDEQEVLVIPKGSYIPEIHYRHMLPVTIAEPLPAEAEAEASQPYRPSGVWRWVALSCAAVAAAAIIGAFWMSGRMRELRLAQEPATSDQNLIKATVLIPGERTLFIVGDPNLETLQIAIGKAVSLEDYLNGHIPELLASTLMPDSEKARWSHILARPQIGAAEMGVIARLLQANPEGSHLITVQHAAEVRGTEFRALNVVLIGNPLANPWIELTFPGFNFQMFYDGVKKQLAIRNQEPKPNEPAQFTGTGDSRRRVGFAHIGVRPNLNRNGMMVVLSGTNSESVAAAAEFVCHREAAPRLCSLLGINDLQQAPIYEVVLRVDSIEGISRDIQVVASRVTLRSNI